MKNWTKNDKIVTREYGVVFCLRRRFHFQIWPHKGGTSMTIFDPFLSKILAPLFMESGRIPNISKGVLFLLLLDLCLNTKVDRCCRLVTF